MPSGSTRLKYKICNHDILSPKCSIDPYIRPKSQKCVCCGKPLDEDEPMGKCHVCGEEFYEEIVNGDTIIIKDKNGKMVSGFKKRFS